MIAAAAGSSVGARKGFSTEKRFLLPALIAGLPREQRSRLNRCEPVAETRFDPVRVGGDQRVLGRKVGVDPVRGLVGGLELAETGEQPLPQRRRLLCPQNSPRQDGRASPCRRGADVAGGLSSAAAAGRSRAATPSLSAASALSAASVFAPSARSGASRSSSPAMPTRVKRA